MRRKPDELAPESQSFFLRDSSAVLVSPWRPGPTQNHGGWRETESLTRDGSRLGLRLDRIERMLDNTRLWNVKDALAEAGAQGGGESPV